MRGVITSPATALAINLKDIAHRHGKPAIPVPLGCAATATILLGALAELRTDFLRVAARTDIDLVDFLNRIWVRQYAAFPYLRGRLHPILGWAHPAARASDVHLARACLTLLADTDLDAAAESVNGDLLGTLYAALRDSAPRGTIYTPHTLAALLPAMNPPENHARIEDVACGAGALSIASVRAMRARNRHPETVMWDLGDIDPCAVALAGVAMAAHGIPFVQLRSADALVAS